jgi:hypothetical protein
MQISSLIRSGCDQRILALVILARSLWLQGYADRAVTTATQALGRANALDHPVSLCVCSMVAVTVFLWTGDWSEADTSIDRLIAHSKEHSLALQLPFLKASESMGNHDSKIVDAGSVD